MITYNYIPVFLKTHRYRYPFCHYHRDDEPKTAFAEAYPDADIVQQLLDNSPLPWGHILRALDKVKEAELRAWYFRAAYEYGWSRAILEHQIDTDLYGRQGKAVTNFSQTLPPPLSDLAQQILKDPYNFDFLTLGPDAQERYEDRQ